MHACMYVYADVDLDACMHVYKEALIILLGTDLLPIYVHAVAYLGLAAWVGLGPCTSPVLACNSNVCRCTCTCTFM